MIELVAQIGDTFVAIVNLVLRQQFYRTQRNTEEFEGNKSARGIYPALHSIAIRRYYRVAPYRFLYTCI